MKGNKFILKLLATCLLAGILVNSACELYVSCEQEGIVMADHQAIKISQSTSPSSNLFLFNRQPTEEENEVHRCSLQPALHYLVRNPELTKNFGKLGVFASEFKKVDSNSSIDIIILQHKFII